MANLQGINLILALVSLILLTYLLFNILRFLKRACWDPIRITKLMDSQGIRGPPYKFFHGSTSEAKKLIKKSMNKSMDLSHNILPRVQPHLHSWIKLYGRNVLTWYGPTPQLVVGDIELVKEILRDREGEFTKNEPPEFMKKMLGNGLVTSNGQKWVKQRKLASHAFRSEYLKEMVPAIVDAVEAMLQKWVEYEGKEIDFFKEFCILTSEIISRTAFGSSYVEGKDVFIKVDELIEIAARNFQVVRLPFFRKLAPNEDDMESDKIEQFIRESIQNLMLRREMRKFNGEDDGYGDDLLGSLMRAYRENESISLDDIIDECKTFYFVGQETTSMMLSWTSFLLALNPDWQEKIRLEVLQVFGDRSLTSEDFSAINKLRQMTMVINESMRLYPPVLGIFRTVAQDCKVGNVLLPKGMQIQISTLVLHHDRNIWGEDAQLFLPERFAGNISGGDAFFPFGIGPRLCVGQGLAMLEAKLALAMILQRYSFTLSPTYVHSPVSRLTCKPQHGLQVVLQRL
ncbi:cytochrome P450 CYP749A22 [Dendrobium catenatum]|uniref:Cytochrome P450 734A1 n=1 Tax=Dendrobium catenatum TaxID=906689 RepID=A0A2I0X809_9ASPA|nr:cytochrome P450 CYP749A22 [Dendrobium catenatum]PKU84032.1 Cytochrome P450 734A1 [Dendrobium catenatum]